MNDNNQTKELSEEEKKCLENTLSCFIFGILGIIIPIFLFSVVSLHYAKLKKYDKLAKLHSAGEKMAYVGIVIGALAIITLSILDRVL